MRQKNDKHQPIFEWLDAIQHGLQIASQVLFSVLIVATVGFSAYVYISRALGPGHQGEYFYFTLAVLLFLGFCVTRLRFSWPRRRQ